MICFRISDSLYLFDSVAFLLVHILWFILVLTIFLIYVCTELGVCHVLVVVVVMYVLQILTSHFRLIFTSYLSVFNNNACTRAVAIHCVKLSRMNYKCFKWWTVVLVTMVVPRSIVDRVEQGPFSQLGSVIGNSIIYVWRCLHVASNEAVTSSAMFR